MNEHCVYIFDHGQNASKVKMECCFPVRRAGTVAPCNKAARVSNKLLCDVHTKIYEDVQRTWMNRVFVENQDPMNVFKDTSVMRMGHLHFLVVKKIELLRFSMLSPYEVETGYQKWRWDVMRSLDMLNNEIENNSSISICKKNTSTSMSKPTLKDTTVATTFTESLKLLEHDMNGMDLLSM